MTTRAQLQSKSIEELKVIAEAAGIEVDGLQKSKLISALMDSGGFTESDVEPETGVDLPRAMPRTERGEIADFGDAPDGEEQRFDGYGGQRRRDRGRNRDRRRDEDMIPEGDLEIREGLLDILPEGYGFLRVTGYTSGEKDVYVSANQVRKFRLRKGDIVSGPIRPPRSKEKFPAVVRIDSVNGMDPEQAMNRPKFETLTP
ncbi:MAG: hypothetical protein L0Z49_13715, partial [Actinobacteria bacterium]|nr:hypothetical protein [Actinomycetota bacterium]